MRPIPKYYRSSRAAAPSLRRVIGIVALVVLGAYGLARVRQVGAHPSTTAASTVAPEQPIVTCTRLAPDDPYGEAGDSLAAALEACRGAVTHDRADTAALYRLGLAELQSKHGAEAFAAFSRADSLGHCGAAFYVAEKLWLQDHDDGAATDAYERSARCGDERAARELLDSAAFAASDHFDDVRALYDVDVDALNKTRFLKAAYVEGMVSAFQEQYLSDEFRTCYLAKLYPGSEVTLQLNAGERGDAGGIIQGYLFEELLPLAFWALHPEYGRQGLEIYRTAQRTAGHADAVRLISHASSCDSVLLYKIMKGARAFAAAKRSLIDTINDNSDRVHSLDDLRRLVR